jgi:hypothetical protein
MNEVLLITLGVMGFMLIVLVLVGLMIVVMYMELPALRDNLSRLNARITGGITSQGGCENYKSKSITLEEPSAQSFTRNMEQQIQQSSMPLSHSECWCNSYRKRDTSNVSKENRG